MELSKLSGLDNVHSETELTQTGAKGETPSWPLTEATNIDLDDAGKPRRRRGFTEAIAGSSHSLYSTEAGDVFAVISGYLCYIRDDLTTVQLTAATDPFHYNEHNGKVYARSRSQSLVIEADLTTHAWGVQHVPTFGTIALAGGIMPAGKYRIAFTYVRTSDGLEGGWSTAQEVELTEQGGIAVTGLPTLSGHTINAYISTPNGEVLYLAKEGITTAHTFSTPAQQLVSAARTYGIYPPIGSGPFVFHQGSFYLVDGGILWVTEPHQLESVRLSSSYMQFEDEIVGLATVTDGVYVATAKGIFFLAGAFPAMQMLRVARYGASVVTEVDPESLEAESKAAVLFVTKRGLCAGYDGGVLVNLTDNSFHPPEAQTAVGFSRQQDGMNQYVGVLTHEGTPLSDARFGTYVSEEIRRF